MPAPQLWRPKRALYQTTLTLTHHVYELHPTSSCRVDLRWTDDRTACVAQIERAPEDFGVIPTFLEDVGAAFLYGDGARNVIEVCQREDRAQQSRRAQREAARLDLGGD